MIFQHTYEWVVNESPHTGLPKTQTRRIVKPYELQLLEERTGRNGIWTDTENRDYPKWIIGHTYAVQPARGKQAVARIEITGISREDVRYISDEDVQAEGFKAKTDFLITWCKMHDKSYITPIIPDYNDSSRIAWHGRDERLAVRPAARYDAWALTFRLCE